jgi:predicted lipoprotein with Yx(FWY)xxD motif
MNLRRYTLVSAIIAAAAVASCSSAASLAPVTAAPASAAPASAAPASAGAGGAVVEAKTVGNFPNILLASQGAKDTLGEDKSGFTLYYFTKDTKSSGATACTDKCATIWPALVVPDGTTPTAGAGVTGTLGTFKRADGMTQVTLNGQPLYFFSKDTAAGQTNGYYPSWGLVNADGSLVAPPSAAPASPAASAAGSPAPSGSSKY